MEKSSICEALKFLHIFNIYRAQCSWVFVGVSFLFASIYAALFICYAVTLENKSTPFLLFPIAGLSFAMAVFYKPKRTDVGYKRFLYFHFFMFAIVSEVGYGVGDFRLGKQFEAWFCIFRVPLWCLAFWLGLKLRASAAKLPLQELSEFLCQTVLVKGTAAMGPMLFFSFETVSCFISQNSLSNGQCNNTSRAAMFLSLYVVISTGLSIVSKTVPKSVQREMSWDLLSIASLNGLKWWQRVQGRLITITAIASLYLLSVLGVERNQNSMVFIIGSMGTVSIAFTGLIAMAMLIRTGNEHQHDNTTVELPTTQRSIRGISAGQVEEGMIAATFV